MSQTVLFSHFIEEKTVDLSYPGTFNRRVARLGFQLRSFWFYSFALAAGWYPSKGAPFLWFQL